MDTIGELSPLDRSKLEEMTPKLQATCKMDGDWRSIISQVMRFPGVTMDDYIRSLWASTREVAAQHGEEAFAEDFARMIVDVNFVKDM